MCICLSGDILYVGLSSGSVLLINLQVCTWDICVYSAVSYHTQIEEVQNIIHVTFVHTNPHHGGHVPI